MTHSFAAEGTYQPAAKTVERPQLILSLRFSRAYQQRERRDYACYLQCRASLNMGHHS